MEDIEEYSSAQQYHWNCHIINAKYSEQEAGLVEESFNLKRMINKGMIDLSLKF